ncbi:MAG: thiamine pyrophosphate-binding protein, partial [Opitutaceae bacterium]
DIPRALREAAEIALHGRPGPVYLDLADEALNGRAAKAPFDGSDREPLPEPPEASIVQAAELLRRAARPAVIFGKGVRWGDAFVELRALVEALGAPFIASPMGRGLLPDDHPLAFTEVSGAVQSGADVVLMAGARWNWQFRFGAQLARDAQVVTVDIHPPEIGVNVRPAVGLAGDAREVLRRLREHVNASGVFPGGVASRQAWLAALEERRRHAAQELKRKMADERSPMSYYRMMRAIAEFLPDDAITILDGNLSMFAAQEVIRCRKPLSRLTVGSNGCVGAGVPFAIGAKLARPDQTVVAICGDSAFGFCAMELETAVRHKIPFVVVVVDNGGMSGARVQRMNYPPGHERVAMFEKDVRYDRLAEGLGAHGEFVEQPAELRPALERATASGRAACVHVRMDPLASAPVSQRF